MGMRTRLVCLGVGLVIGLVAGTQFVAAQYSYQPALGWGLPICETAKLYPPWNILVWADRWAESREHGPLMRAGASLILLGVGLGVMLIRLFDTGSLTPTGGQADTHVNYGHRARGWGDPRALIKAGLAVREGVVLGRIDPRGWRDRFLNPRLLKSPDMRPALVTGGTRSGKGRGVVIPSLLNWSWSTIVFDPKGELWNTTAGYRAQLGPALFFNPLHGASARFNPLAEIATGKRAVAEVQKLVAILAEPGGASTNPDFWDRQGAEMLSALILHVLHAAPADAKSLVTVKRLSADLDEAAKAMSATRHIKDADGEPVTHPFIADVASAYLSAHEKGRKSIQMTVRSYLGWISGPQIERTIGTSDFRLGDLMCARAPVSLYVQIAPSDLKTLQPLVRLFFHLAASTFTTHVETDADGRTKENALLLTLDEFPLLGKVSFFEDVVRLSAGYGIKCLFVAQSLNDIARIYGPMNGFLDNTHIYVAFAALDPDTRNKVSRLTGTVTDTRRSASLPHHFSGSGGSRTIAEVERPLLDPAEVGALPDDEQLVFIAGHRPYRLPKLKYDELDWMAQRAAMPPHRQADELMTPERPAHPWAGISPAGFGNPADYLTFEDRAELRRIQVEIERDERVAAARAAHRAANQAGKEAGTEANRGAEDLFDDQGPGPVPAGPLFQRPDAAARASEQDESNGSIVPAMAMPSDQPANGPADAPANDPANDPAESPAPEPANNSGASPAPRPARKAARGGARASRTSGEAADARTLLDLMHRGEA